MNEVLRGMSSDQLRSLARDAMSLASELRRREPSADLALLHGVRDRSYDTVRHGRVLDYDGEAIVQMDDGSKWRCVGHGPTGTPEEIYREGYIEYIPILPDRGEAGER